MHSISLQFILIGINSIEDRKQCKEFSFFGSCMPGGNAHSQHTPEPMNTKQHVTFICIIIGKIDIISTPRAYIQSIRQNVQFTNCYK